jgi:hypothetical protein
MRQEVREAARAAQSSVWFRRAARAGFAANGVVHAIIGVIVLAATLGADTASDQTGAFRGIAAVPLGFVVLWSLAAALWALAAWHLLQAVLARRADLPRKLGRIVSEAGQALAFGVIGALAAVVAAGGRPDAEEAAEGASRGVLTVPGGNLLLGAVGLGVGIAGIAFVTMGVLRSFRKKVALPSGWAGVAVGALGVFGFVAKGAALVTVGVLLIIAAIRLDPQTAGGLDGAVHALLNMPAGPLAGWTVGLGFISYGVFNGFRAVYARLDA